MSMAENLLERKAFAEFLANHQGAAAAVARAAEFMETEGYTEEEAARSLKKLLPALTEKVLNVFFSYKKVDEKAAEAIVKILRKYSAGKLQITYMADFGKDYFGQHYRNQILEAIDRANWFILLLPDSSEDWDWCLYETGLFERELTKADRLICLHHPNTEVPDQIKDYQAISATEEAVSRFLRGIFVEENPIPGLVPINGEIESEIGSIANELVNAIRPPKHGTARFRFEPWIKLRVKNAANLQNKEDLDSAVIENTNKEALDLFDMLVKPPTWGDLRAGVEEPPSIGSRWREELFHVIRKIANGRRFDPIQAVFTARNGKIIRPVVLAVDRYGEAGPITAYHINFLEEVGAIDAAEVPQGVSSLATLLSMAYRFRWEVLERFTKRELDEHDLERVENVLRRIEHDAESRRLLSKFAVKSLFPPEEAERIDRMFLEWAKLRDQETQEGMLDIALRNKDSKAVSAMLKDMVPMNQEFLEIAADRFSEVISHMD